MTKKLSSVGVTLIAVSVLWLAGCGNKEASKPPEKVTHVTVAHVAQKDLPLTESAVGTETALGVALDYDPTRGSGSTFYIRLPFPEQVASQLKLGQAVTLTAFTGNKSVQGRIREIRPPLNVTTQSRDVIVAVNNTDWRPEGSIRGEVNLGMRRNALIVPEQAVVLRPAGTVLYLVDGDRVVERPVRTGIARDGIIEILADIPAAASVVVDGAALLSNNAKIKIRDADARPASGKPGA